MTQPRFVSVYKGVDGVRTWRYSPPQDVVANGIVARCTLGTDRRRAFAEATRLNKIVDDFRAGKIAGTTPKPKSTLKQVVVNYYTTTKFKKLTGYTQISYENQLNNIMNTVLEGKPFCDYRMHNIGVRECALLYELWCERGVTTANDYARIISIIFNYAIQLEIIMRNPMRHVDKITSQIRQVKWTNEHLKAFLHVAYSDFRYRNIGLIVHMAYEWCQRIGDIRIIKWDAIDLAEQRVTITQSKRGATVHLPLTKSLTMMLADQKKDFGFQDYVVPNVRASDGTLVPYANTAISGLINEVKELAQLPKDIKAWDLRRTGITELVEAGADSFHIMQVSGHKNINSVRPYLVNTYKGANIAMTMRFGSEELGKDE
jgi:integrase